MAPRKLTAAKPIAEAQAEPAAPAKPVTAQQRAAMAQRIQSVVEREMDAIERVLDVIRPDEPDEAELSARALAAVSRTLREIRALNAPEDEAPPDAADDDAVPRDIDEFREALARRIEAFIDDEQGGAGAPDADAGDGAQSEGA
jgi:hypothetical protein